MRWREIELGLENEGISLACEQSILFIECSTAGTFFFFLLCLFAEKRQETIAETICYIFILTEGTCAFQQNHGCAVVIQGFFCPKTLGQVTWL